MSARKKPAKNFHLTAVNQLYLVFNNKVNLLLKPVFQYDKFDRYSNYISGTFSSMQYDVSREMLDNIYAVGSENLIRNP